MDKTLDKKIREYLNKNRAQYIEDLKKLISFPSVKSEAEGNKPYGAEIANALDFMMSLCSDSGLKTTNYDYYCMDAEYGEGEEVIAALAHLDVVPAGDGWTVSPFQASMVGSCMYGRGVCDNKGPGLAALYALKALMHADVKLKRKIRLIYGCDEESGMSDMKYYLSKTKAPDYAFSPDAIFPLIFAEKHRINGAYSCEIPGNTALISIQAGIAVNSVPSIATAQITTQKLPESTDKLKFSLTGDTLTVTAYGVASHAAVPQNGDNAITILIHALLEVMEKDDTAAPYLKSIVQHMSAYNGEGLGVDCSDEPSGALTFNLGIISYADQALSLKFDIRHPVTIDCRRTMDKLADALPLFTLTEIEMHRGVYMPKDSYLVKTLLDVYREITGDKSEPLAMGGATYASTLPNAVAFGARMIGSSSGGTHGTDEHCDIDEFIQAAVIFAHCFYRFATVTSEDHGRIMD